MKAAPLSIDELASRSKGLVGLTGCMGGLVAQAVLEEGEVRGRETLAALRGALEPGNLYVELQDHGLPEQPVLNGILAKLAADLALPLVATNDVHYAERADAEAHLYLSCIKTGRSLEEARERHHGSSEMYLKSPAEMAQLFSAYPQAVRATLEIAEKCQTSLKLGEPMLPSFKVPEGYDTPGYFRHVAREGLTRRLDELEAQGKRADRRAYAERLETELDVIAGMNFAGYFLIVWDFIRYAKDAGVPVGPGRGSGAGSIVAYAMRITDLDPIPYNLLFERFLNPERVSMPDFDIDFCMDRRDQVIAYVQSKYGETSVGQIATFAELKSKSVVKDVARCMGITAVEAQQIANLIPRKTPAETYTIAEALEVEPKLKAMYDREPRIKELLDQARKLEGLTRHAGKHAAGIVISEGPLWDHVPVFRAESAKAAAAATGPADGGVLVTQYYKDDVELAGLVKFDFLGLKTLTVLDIAARLVNSRPDFVREGKTLDLARIPMDDAATYKLLASGETKGVFQLESSGMQQLFKDLRPDGFEDVIAAVALYRPGPLGSGMVEDFVNRKHGRAAIASLHPLVDTLLAPTYGVIVYQEQVMQIAQRLAGYTLGCADLLRRAMGKKKPEEMAKQKSVFVGGATAKGVTESEAERIFGLLEYFAGYGFNKSHSAAYALITYQTAWLKAHYPVELLCAILTSDKERIEKVVRTIADARAMGMTVLPPDVNESGTDFKVVYTHPEGGKPVRRGDRIRDALGPQIRFGLGAVRGLGGAALEAVFEARRDGRFRDLFDLAARIDAKRVTKGVFEALVQCGAFDTTLQERGVSRARLRVDRRGARALARGEPRPGGGADDALRALRRGAQPRLGRADGRGLRRVRALGPARAPRPRAAGARVLRVGPPPRAVREGRRRSGQGRRGGDRRLRVDGRLGAGEAGRDGRGLPRANLQGWRRQGGVLRAGGPDRPRGREAPRPGHRPVRPPAGERRSGAGQREGELPPARRRRRGRRRRRPRAHHPAERGAAPRRCRARRYPVDRDPCARRAHRRGRPLQPREGALGREGHLPGGPLRQLRRRGRGPAGPRRCLAGRCGRRAPIRHRANFWRAGRRAALAGRGTPI